MFHETIKNKQQFEEWQLFSQWRSAHGFCLFYCTVWRIFSKWATTLQNQQNDCAPSEDSDQPGHLPSLIRVFAVRMKKAWILRYPLNALRRRYQTGQMFRLICLRWAHTHFVGCVMSWLNYTWFVYFPTCPITIEILQQILYSWFHNVKIGVKLPAFRLSLTPSTSFWGKRWKTMCWISLKELQIELSKVIN